MEISVFLKYALVCVSSILATLLSKFLWDRYFSQSSRVTKKEFCNKLSEIEKRLDAGANTFKHINVCLITTSLVLLKICEEVGIDCEDIKKMMIDNGLDL